MKIHFRILFCALYSFCFLSCKKDSKIGPALLVGTYRVLDQNIPFPFLLEIKNDTLFLIDHKNRIIDHSGKVEGLMRAGDTLQMKEHSFFVVSDGNSPLLFDLKDSLNFPYPHYTAGARFRPARGEINVTAEEVKEKLIGKVFEAEIVSATPNRDLKIRRTCRFTKDSLTSVYSYFYQDQLMYREQQVRGFHLFERQGNLFFSENESPEDPQMLYQITNIGEGSSFKIRYYRNGDEIEEFYNRKDSHVLSKGTPQFSKCLDGQPGEYYHDNITYTKGNEYLLKKISSAAPRAEGDGYITVHFTINCHGEVGRLGLEQMDRKYRSTTFDPALVKHLISEVTALTDWPEIPPGYFYKDVHAFLMFKISDGKITDLIP